MKKPSPDYRIGDVEPVPADADMDAARIAMRMRGHLTKQAKRKGKTEIRHRAVIILAGLAEAEHRRTDPVERAKTYLRRRGYKPVAKIATRRWQVGSHVFDSERDLMDFARLKGWKP